MKHNEIVNKYLLSTIKSKGPFAFFAEKKQASAFALNAAKVFVKQAIKDYPELQDFKEVLSNPVAMQNVTILISNHLRPSEQQQILDIVKTLPKQPTKSEFVTVFQKIIQIIQGHIHVHPEFIPALYSEMAHESHIIYIAAAQERNRKSQGR